MRRRLFTWGAPVLAAGMVLVSGLPAGAAAVQADLVGSLTYLIDPLGLSGLAELDSFGLTQIDPSTGGEVIDPLFSGIYGTAEYDDSLLSAPATTLTQADGIGLKLDIGLDGAAPYLPGSGAFSFDSDSALHPELAFDFVGLDLVGIAFTDTALNTFPLIPALGEVGTVGNLVTLTDVSSVFFQSAPTNDLTGEFFPWVAAGELALPPEGAAPVPEPGTLILLGSGLAGLAGARRRRAAK